MRAADHVLRKKMEVVLQRAFLEVRDLAVKRAHQQVFDLADAFEAIPERLACLEEEAVRDIRGLLQEYQGKYRGLCFDYVSILDMADAEFASVFESKESF